MSFRVVCGPTGSGKTRLIGALAAAGSQVLDLESIAAHRGSLLGGWPDRPQPSQKAFETCLWDAMRRLDPARPIYVEAESRKIGDLRVPEALIHRMRAADCVRVDTPDAARVALLMREYAHFFAEPAVLIDKLKALTALHGHARIDAWVQDAEAGRWEALVATLLEAHYDPAYAKSAAGHFPGLANAVRVALPDTSDAALGQAAAALANPDRILTRPETADRPRVSSAPTANLINEEIQPLRLQMTATTTRLSDKNATPQSTPRFPSSPTLLPEGEGSRRPLEEGSGRHPEEGSRRHPSPSGRGTEGEGR